MTGRPPGLTRSSTSHPIAPPTPSSATVIERSPSDDCTSDGHPGSV